MPAPRIRGEHGWVPHFSNPGFREPLSPRASAKRRARHYYLMRCIHLPSRTGYCVMHEASCDLPNSAHVTVDAAYLETNQPVVREQRQKAGVRLARMLD